MLHFNSFGCLKKIFPLMNKWYHILVSYLFVVNPSDLTTKIGFSRHVKATLSYLRHILEHVKQKTAPSLLDLKL